ncbi:putative WW domain-containing adapter protein with coiled-coil isoform X2 [Apostichopus japonicus]|uniref:Putative WW domain-containing adapter protein with coiled-coil isoform X2 n=1 Tax=Stichopus japonicus TaxID=307972 RepID=A0A2G8LGM9_STIJA|nr:putative WW domain-containing adapter protein with coiled-coil isoform X2 [Apostichopus japonicus]
MNSAVSAEELVVPPPIAKPTEEELHFNNIIFSTETHSNYYSEDLVKHKVNSPVEQLEKQVMMDLKFARSLVRTTEIQANVQASRIVFLRQQVKELEKLKNENAYMT